MSIIDVERSKLHDEFEQLDLIKRCIEQGCIVRGSDGCYYFDEDLEKTPNQKAALFFVRGAWHAYCKKQEQIEEVLSYIRQNDNFELRCLIDIKVILKSTT